MIERVRAIGRKYKEQLEDDLRKKREADELFRLKTVVVVDLIIELLEERPRLNRKGDYIGGWFPSEDILKKLSVLGISETNDNLVTFLREVLEVHECNYLTVDNDYVKRAPYRVYIGATLLE